MASAKRTFANIEDEKNENEDAEFGQKRRKIDLLENDMQIDSTEETENTLNSVEGIVAFMLTWMYKVPEVIIKLILEYNTCSVWYGNGWSGTEMFFDYLYGDIDDEIVDVQYAFDVAFLQSKDGKIWCKGSNAHCQLGLGHDKEVKQFVMNEFFKNKTIKIENIWTDEKSFSIFQDKNGKIYGCGYQTHNQFGFGWKPCDIIKPELIDGIENVEQICIGLQHCIVLDRNGTVYSTKMYGYLPFATICAYAANGDGSNNFSQYKDNFHPIPFFQNVKIIAISVGEMHSLFVQENGVVWSCGLNKSSQLGYGHSAILHQAYPKKIQFLIENNIKIKTCASGAVHNLLLDSDGNVYTFGRSCFEACGLGSMNEVTENVNEPTMIKIDKKFDNIQCGKLHSYMKSVCNIHFLFGNNERNQCGLLKVRDNCIYKPLAINEIVKEIVMGEFIEIKTVCVVEEYTIMNIVEIQ